MIDKLKNWWAGAVRQRWMLALFILSTAVLAYTHSAQIGIIVLKVSLVSGFAALGYFVDRSAAPYARPDDMIDNIRNARNTVESAAWAQVAAASSIRRAIIIGACMLAGALAL